MTDPADRFTVRGARSPAVTIVLGLVLAVETGALHLFLSSHHPLIAWTLTAASLSTLAWLIADYRAMGISGIRVTPNHLELRIGRRLTALVPRDRLASATLLTWRDLSALPDGSLNATKPATPNVLLSFRDPVIVRLLGVVARPVRYLALRVDEPERFIAGTRPAP